MNPWTNDTFLSLADMFFIEVTSSALDVLDAVLGRHQDPAETVAGLTSYKIENLAIFFDVSLDLIEQEGTAPTLSDEFGHLTLAAFEQGLAAILKACCDTLTHRTFPVPAHIALSRRGVATPVDPSSPAYQA